MATRLIGTDDTNPRLPAVVIAATQGTTAADLAPGDTLAEAVAYTDAQIAEIFIGGVDFATDAETIAGVETFKAVTPAGLNAKLAYVDVREHGAVGDGTTDDQAAFTTAIATGLPVYVPPGTFAVTELTVPAGTTIFGDGDKSIVKRHTATAAQARVFNITGSNIDFHDFKVDGNGLVGAANSGLIQSTPLTTNVRLENLSLVDAPSAAIIVAASETTIRGCRIVNTGEGGIVMSAEGLADDLEDIHIVDNFVDRSMVTDTTGHHGILVRGSNDGTTRKMRRVVIADNIVHQAPGGGICIEAWCYEMLITGNVTEGGYMGISTLGSHHAVSGNTVRGAATAGIELATSGGVGSGKSLAVGNTVIGEGVMDTGIVMSNTGGPDEVNVSSNFIRGVTGRGIYILGPARSLITGNYIALHSTQDANSYGIHFLGIGRGLPLAYATVTGNFVDGYSVASGVSAGVQLDTNGAAADPDVSLAIVGNTFTNVDTGIVLYGFSVDLRGTVVGNNIDASVTTPIWTQTSGTGTTSGLVYSANRGDTLVGFYGTPPITKQTGVAVSAAGIHAALVNLGLISA